MANLSTVKNRESLKPGREPHWQRLAVGNFLGYRPLATGPGGNWIARHYETESRKYRFHALGDFGHLPANERFSAATESARDWFQHMASGGSHEVVTVKEACERYAASHPDANRRFQRYVYGDPIATVHLRKLKERQVKEWRARLEALPALVSHPKNSEPVTRKRATATVNRDMVAFRAALNFALSEGAVLTPAAWKYALKPAEANGRRDVYLDRDQRRELLKHLPTSALAFVTALCVLPLRPGALSHVLVKDFDSRTNMLYVRKDKAGSGRRIQVSIQGAALLKEQSQLKLPLATIFTRGDGMPWSKDTWKGPIKKAATAAALPAGSTAYALRHSAITDVVQGGLPLLAVAQLFGTSVRMIEKHYGHFQQEQAVKALSTLSL
jgi:integrase